MADKLSDFNKNLKKALVYKSIGSEPYISVNKLAEYMNANATRRRQIVNMLKDDKDFWKLRYQDARAVIPKYFRNGYDNRILDKAIKRIEERIQTPGLTKWDIDDAKNSILAIDALKKTEFPDLSDYEIIDNQKLDYIELAGVKVTIKPEIYLENIHSKKIGGVKFHLSKGEQTRLELTGMQYAATIIKYGFIDKGIDVSKIDNNACISIDIFERNYATSPAAYVQRVNALTAACEEIALRWDSI
jgi:hypothetical protein